MASSHEERRLPLPKCDIIVVGGSAGSVDGMQRMVRAFPADLNAAVFVVLHLSPHYPSMLPQILSRSGPLPAHNPQDGEKIQPGRIYVAPPDRHLTIEDSHVRVIRGPRENRHRPAIDPLFRTASRVFNSRVIGVILSGNQDDGSAGLRAIRARGGIGIIQDPEEAAASQMPQSALEYSGADYVLPQDEIGAQVAALVDHCGRPEMKKKKPAPATKRKKGGVNETEANLEVSRPKEGVGVPSPFACPECGGVLWEMKNGELTRFRCRVGHAYTMSALAQDQSDGVEAALWAAMRALEEKAALSTRMAESTRSMRSGERLREQAEADRTHAEIIRKMLFDGEKEEKESA
jgi:two-component system chemotaxis response regulator CheB